MDWLPESVFFKLVALEEVHPNCKGLIASVKSSSNQSIWRKVLDADDPAAIPLPEPLKDKLTPFQKLMVIKVMREEKLVYAIKKFVAKELGNRYIESPPFDLVGAANDSTNMTPIIFVLSPGADPIADLIALAKSKGMD